MPEKKKAMKFPAGASKELKATEAAKKHWTEEAESVADRLAKAEWHSYNSRPRGESNGYFVILHWYTKEKVWVPIYLQQGNVSSLLAKLFNNREATPISKYLTSFPRTERKLLWSKWLLDSSADTSGKGAVEFEDVLRAFGAKYNQGETLAFNMDEDQPEIPENFSLLDY